MEEERVKKYLMSSGLLCPYCGSKNLDAGPPNCGDYLIYRFVNCLDCNKEWTENYTLTGIEDY